MGLKEYRKKRDFKKTREPSGGKTKTDNGRIFVVQEHHASHLHYDFRLELNGVLKSWAVPKGPSQVPHEKRLAVETEDHPLSYADFEGEIPKGEYGGGTVKIWDHGEWIPDPAPNAQLKKGHLEFELQGEKLHGRWMLVRTHPRANSKKANWLLMKKNDLKTSPARAKSSIKKTKLPAFIPPQLASLSAHPPDGNNWVHEIKFDGYRTACRIDGKKIELLTRRGHNWADKYAVLEKECRKIPAKTAYLDGEVVWVDEQGKTKFQGLQNVLTSGKNENIYFYVFDLLHLDGENLQDLPLLERKKILKTLLKKTNSKRILFSEHWETRGSEIFKASCKMNLEGIISKNTGKGYEPGRGNAWLKSKCKHVQEFVIGGYTPQKNGTGLGSLIMGAFDENHKLRYIGKIGTGYGAKESSMLLKKLKKLRAKTSPFEIKSPREKAAVYVKPELVANVEFAEWTDEKVLRHAAYKGLREDKAAAEVYISEPTAASKEVQLTHPDKVLFPATKNTKQDLANYYTAVQKFILPHLVERPLSLLRCPSGAGKQCFFQKHAEGTIPGIYSDQTASKTKGEIQEIIYAKDHQGLMGLVQMNTLELHKWGCSTKNIDNPDLIVFDLDPDDAVEWKKVKQAALTLKKMLERLGLKSFLNVTGGKGLHLHVPIEPMYSWEQVKSFAKSVCDKMALDEPALFLTTATKSKRKGKIFLDYLRNGYGATAIVPYSARAKPNATVALPLSWSELARLKAPDTFNIVNVPKLMKKRRDPWIGYFKLRQRIKILDKM